MPTPQNITLNDCQQKAFDRIMLFAETMSSQVFILKGYAGTGKTTLMKFVIDALQQKNYAVSLLASTGRAAKILSNLTGQPTATVHGTIYTFVGLNEDLEKMTKEREKAETDTTGQLFLNFDLASHSTSNVQQLYIVDESSMIADVEVNNQTQAIFGTGRLLRDLLEYDKTGKFIFVGDICQLPPVTQSISPALSAEYFQRTFHIHASEAELTEVMRQADGNDIVLSASRMRKLYYNPQQYKWAKFPLRGYKNIHLVNGQMKLINDYIEDVRRNGYNKTTLITYSNKQCDMLTKFIRPALGIKDACVTTGDLLLVTQNNYITGLMNGDLVTVQSTGNRQRRAGLTFLEVTVKELFTGKTFNQLMVEEILYANQTNLSQPQQKELMIDFYYRMKDRKIAQHTKLFNQMMLEDPYLNALRAVYGYALTCHKSQGGEWEHVYLDIPRYLASSEKPFVYQWMYTAMTRASKELYTEDDFWIM